jgi:hypothetical protein
MLLDFTNPVLDPRITFSRGTGATRVNASGFVETVGTTTPRFDYDPVTLAPRGLLIEEARTNLATYSEQFDNAAWVKEGATVTGNATASPDGTINADTIIESATTGVHRIQQAQTLVSSTAYTFSVFVKRASGSRNLSINCSTIGNAQGLYDIAAGVVIGTAGTAANLSASVQKFANGWVRCTLTMTGTGTPNNVYLQLAPSTETNPAWGASYTGDGTSGIFVYGAQLEAGAFATSYIPTVASTVSRSADNASMTGTNFSTWYNQTEGTFVVNLTPIGMPVGASNTRYLEANDGTANNRKPLLFAAPAGTSAAQYRVAGADQAVLTSSAGAFAVGTNLRVATAYAVNDFAASYNGATALTDASGSVSNTATQLTIGYATSGAGSEIYNGHIRAIAYYNTRLPNTQLQTLTAPSLASPLALDFISPTYTVGY